jgi:hypothetical protein
VDGPVLTFGDKTNDNIVFIAANYKESAGQELYQLIYLEQELFQSWILNGRSPPKSEEWILISFLDWQANHEPSQDTFPETTFENVAAFQMGCALFIQYCANLRDQKDPLCERLLLNAPAVDDESQSENDLDDRDDENEDAVELLQEQPKEAKSRKRRDPNAQPTRASDRIFTNTINRDEDEDPPQRAQVADFQMPKRGRKSAASKKKESSARKKNASETKKAPARRREIKSTKVDDAGFVAITSVLPKTPLVSTTPVLSTATPISAAPAYTFDVGMAQQDRILDYLERSANFIFDKAERYKFG